MNLTFFKKLYTSSIESYDYFTATEKFVHTAVPQLVADYLDQFRDRLVVEFETYFNGEKMHHDDIAKAISDILAKSISKTGHELKITF